EYTDCWTEDTSGSGSWISLLTLEHLHEAVDWKVGDDAIPSCASCKTGSCGGDLSLDHGLPSLSVSRIHRYRRSSYKSSHGPGTLSWWDVSLQFDGATKARLETPAMANHIYRFESEGDGQYTVLGGTGHTLRLLDADGDQVVHPRFATTAVLEMVGGATWEFELLHLSSKTRFRNGRLRVLNDRFGNAITLTHHHPVQDEPLDPAVYGDVSESDWPGLGGTDVPRREQLQIATVTDAHGRSASVSYDEEVTDRIVSIEVPTGTITYTYDDESGMLTGVQRPDGTTSSFTFAVDEAESATILSIDDPASVDMHRRKDVFLTLPVWVNPEDPEDVRPQGANRVRKIVNGAGEVTFEVWYDQRRSNDWSVLYVYDGGRQLRRIHRSNHYGVREASYAENYTYGSEEPVTWITKSLSEYETAGKRTAAADALGRIQRRSYDAGSLTVEDAFFPDGSMIDEDLNAFNDPVRRVSRDGDITEWEYNAAGAMVARIEAVDTPEEARWEYERNARGQKTAMIDPLGHRTDYEYNADGYLVAEIQPADLPGGERPVTRYVYDDAGRVVEKIRPGGQTIEYSYDAANRVVEIAYAPDDSEYFTYGSGHEAGLVVEHVDRVGTVTTKTYDLEARLVEKQVHGSDAALLATTSYDYLHGSHEVQAMVEDGDRTEYSYDGLNRRVATTRHVDADTALTSRTVYDEAGQRVLDIDPYGRATARLYDINGRVVRTVQELTPDVVSEALVRQAWLDAHPIPAEEPLLSGFDVGDPKLSGSDSLVDGVLSITAGGYEMWDRDDEFRMVGRELPQDGLIYAQVTSVENSHPWAKAGVMFRADDAPDAPYAFIGVAPQYGLFINARRFPGGLTDYHPITPGGERPDPVAGEPFPAVYVAMRRDGPQVHFYSSWDGDTWADHGMVTLTWSNDSLLAGFTMMSHEADVLA
ncbi:MAG: RHS repeat domain-containing protein, partial [Planctomycetota bacterium]